MHDRPKTLEELFAFYDTYVKILYGSVQADNILPVEVLFEINAAFDHVSRVWVYGENEETVVYKAHSHLKRACLDIFKLRVKQILDQYKELKQIDTSFLDNGRYETEMRRLAHEIKREAANARKLEGKPSDDDEVAAFSLWQPIFDKCETFESHFYLHADLDWAKKTHRKFAIWGFIGGIITTGFADALLSGPLTETLKHVGSWIWKHELYFK